MIIDSLLQLSEKQNATGTSDNTIDFAHKKPNSGLASERLYLVVTGAEGFAGAATLDVDLEHSDAENTGFALVAKSGAQTFGVGKQVIIPMPIEHKRYIRAKYTATGAAGKVDAMLVTGLQLDIKHPESGRVW